MIKRAGIVAVTLLVFAIACDDSHTVDCTSCKCNPSLCPPKFEDLTKKSNVLNNFELAHNRRDANHYDAVIDDNFTLYYSEGNVGGGTPFQWGRDTDLAATHELFASVDRLDFDLSDPDGTAWNETPAPGGLESWYVTTVSYHFTIQIGNTTYIPNAEAKMSLTVRNAGTDAAPSWRLVELHDLGGPTLLSATHAAGTEPTTYGKIKSLFRP